MEFANVGRHCAMAHCQQQDFLPFKCEFCNKIYCGDHRRPDDHNCPSCNSGAIDDNYVIICPLCQTALSLKGKAKLGITPAHVWNEHVETGECQLKQNQRYQKEMAGGRAAICQCKGCKTKLTDINYFKCPHCAMDLCMAHRFADLHDCKPVKKSQEYERLKKKVGIFNWGKNDKKGKKKDDEPSLGDKILRFFVCCGSEKPKIPKDKDPKYQQKEENRASRQKTAPTKKLGLKCPLCGEIFEDRDYLMIHMTVEHPDDQPEAETKVAKAVAPAPKKTTKQCPECFKRFAVEEFETHMQQEHFM